MPPLPIARTPPLSDPLLFVRRCHDVNIAILRYQHGLLAVSPEVSGHAGNHSSRSAGVCSPRMPMPWTPPDCVSTQYVCGICPYRVGGHDVRGECSVGSSVVSSSGRSTTSGTMSSPRPRCLEEQRAMDFGSYPPEVNSARMFAGAGSGP